LELDETAEELDLSSIHAAINNIQGSISTIQGNVSTNTNDITSLRTDLTAEQTTLAAAQTLIATLQSATNTNAAGLVNLIASLATVATSGSYPDLINIPSSFNGAGNVKQYSFTNSMVWTVNHNMNTRTFVPTLFDANGNNFYANIQTIDNNTFAVNLTDAATGVVNVYFP